MTLEDIVGAALAAQCRQDPQPPDLRGHILAKINVWVPIDQPIEPWLLALRPAPPAATRRERMIEVACQESGTHSGRYTCRYEASGTISMPESRLRELILQAGSRDQAVEDFINWADENREVETDEETDFHYEEDDSDSEDSSSNARTVIEEYLDEHPELLEDVTPAPEAVEEDDEEEDEEEDEDDDEEEDDDDE